jgi:WD40 repeat protein
MEDMAVLDLLDSTLWGGGMLLASGSMDKTVKVWELNHVICSMNHVDCSLNHVIGSLNHANCSLNHVNCLLNCANYSLNHVNCSRGQVWELDTNECLWTGGGHLGAVTCVAFHPLASALQLASASVDKTIKVRPVLVY